MLQNYITSWFILFQAALVEIEAVGIVGTIIDE